MANGFRQEAPPEVWEALGLEYPGAEAPPPSAPPGQEEAPPEVWEALGLTYPQPQIQPATLTSETMVEPPPEPEMGALQAAGRGAQAGLTQLAHGVGVGTKWLGEKVGSETALGGFLVERGESARQYWSRVGEQFAPPPGLEISGVMDAPERMANASWWTYNLAQVAPSLAASIVPGVGAYKAIRLGERAFHWSPALAHRLAMVGATVTGGITGGSLEGAGAYEEVLREGGTEQEAIDAYEYMTLASAGLNAVGLLPILNPVGGNVLTKFLVGGSVEGLTEWAEEPTQAAIICKIRTGEYDLERMARAARESVGVIPIAGVLGGGAAAIGGGVRPTRPAEDAIIKRKDGYHVISKEGKNLGGPYRRQEIAERRLQRYLKSQQAAAEPTVTPEAAAGRLGGTQVARGARQAGAGPAAPTGLTPAEEVAKFPQAAALEAPREVEGRMRAEFGETAPEAALVAQTVPAPGAVNEPVMWPEKEGPAQETRAWPEGAANVPEYWQREELAPEVGVPGPAARERQAERAARRAAIEPLRAARQDLLEQRAQARTLGAQEQTELLESTEAFGRRDQEAEGRVLRGERGRQEPGRAVPEPRGRGAETAAGGVLQAQGRPTEAQARARPEQEAKDVPPVAPALDEAAHEAAPSPLNERPAPTEAQIKAGNYKKGPLTLGGMRISIENPAGSKRRPEWPALKSHYGYIRQTKGPDKDKIDVFVGPEAERIKAGEDMPVYVIQQQKADGTFDEYKVMLGYAGRTEARDAYLENYPAEQRQRIGRIKKFPDIGTFKSWVYDKQQTTKPLVPPTPEETAETLRDYEKSRTRKPKAKPTDNELQKAQAALAAQDEKIGTLNGILRCLQT